MDEDGIVHYDWIDKLIQSKYNINCVVYRTIPKDDWDEPKLKFFDDIEDDDEYSENVSEYDKKILSPAIHLVDTFDDYNKLIAAGANVNSTNEHGQTIFFNTDMFAEYMLFDEEDDPEEDEYHIFSAANVNIKDRAGQTALSMAIPKMLMNVYGQQENGVIDAEDVKDEDCCDYYKNFSGHYNYIKWLLKQGANVKGGNAKTKALLKLKPEKFVKEIVKVGLDINSRDIDGYTALHKLVQHKVSGIVPIHPTTVPYPRYINTELYDPIKLLLDTGASVNVRDNLGRTPLHYAQNPHVIQALLKAGANINEADNDGLTPLHLAVTENAGALDALLEACPDASKKSKDGKTALDVAVTDWLKEELTLYNKLGCKAYQKAASKKTSILMAPKWKR